jgi:hypothetical protein
MTDEESTTEVPWEEVLKRVDGGAAISGATQGAPHVVIHVPPDYGIKPPKKRRCARKPKASLVVGPLASEAADIDGPWISVPGWKSFQHYGDKRVTPWIKVQTAWLTDYRFLRLADHQKLALFLIWILAAKRNKLPADPEWLGWRLGISSPVDLKGLIEAGFLELHGAAVESLPGVVQGIDSMPSPSVVAVAMRRATGAEAAPHERPIVWPPPEGEEDDGRTMDQRVDQWEKNQPI